MHDPNTRAFHLRAWPQARACLAQIRALSICLICVFPNAFIFRWVISICFVTDNHFTIFVCVPLPFSIALSMLPPRAPSLLGLLGRAGRGWRAASVRSFFREAIWSFHTRLTHPRPPDYLSILAGFVKLRFEFFCNSGALGGAFAAHNLTDSTAIPTQRTEIRSVNRKGAHMCADLEFSMSSQTFTSAGRLEEPG